MLVDDELDIIRVMCGIKKKNNNCNTWYQQN